MSSFTVCTDGYYKDGTTCTICPENTYKAGTDMNPSCNACATGHSTNGGTGKSAATQCDREYCNYYSLSNQWQNDLSILKIELLTVLNGNVS